MIRRLFRAKSWIYAIALIAIGALGACETTVTRPVIPELSFKHLPALSFAVGRIEIVEKYRSPLRLPNVEHLFPTPISAALRRWSDDRLQAEGGPNVMHVIIEDASAVAEELETDKDLEALFTTEQAERVVRGAALRGGDPPLVRLRSVDLEGQRLLRLAETVDVRGQPGRHGTFDF